MKIITILGARPQFIKAATLSRVFKNNPNIKEIIIHTGQHYDENMSDIFFEQMEIPRPDFCLEIKSKHHGEMTALMLMEIEKIIIAEKPDIVLVYGDTNSTLAGGLAASKLGIRLAHVEAGLRSYNRKMPEEINRVLVDHVSDLLFAPTIESEKNLRKEGIDATKIFKVGDVMFDALKHYLPSANDRTSILADLGVFSKPFILATIHRAENTNHPKRLSAIFTLLKKIAEKRLIVLPLHPRTKSLLTEGYEHPNLKLIDPVGYFEMLALQKNCQLVATDSGGVQKEAFLHKKYCITLREETEWIELVNNGFNFLANPLTELPRLVDELWDRPFNDHGFQPYGDGNAAEEISEILINKKDNQIQ